MSNHDPYSDSPSLLVGFSITNSTRAWEPTLSWNQLRSKLLNECYVLIATVVPLSLSNFRA
jgi:hypothetical protein